MLIQRRVLLRRLRAGAFAAAGLLLLAHAVWPWTPFARLARPPRTIVFYGFSILGDVIDHGVFPAFGKQWRERTGERSSSPEARRLRYPDCVIAARIRQAGGECRRRSGRLVSLRKDADDRNRAGGG